MKKVFDKIKGSLTAKITIAFIIIFSVVGLFAFSGYYYLAKKTAKQEQITLAGHCARTAANLLHNAPINTFLDSGKNKIYYVYFSALKIICRNFNLKYLYVYVPDFKNNKLTMIFDINDESVQNVEDRDLGTIVPWKFTTAEHKAYFAEDERGFTETNNKFGHVITKYAVVYNNKNEPIALVGADVSVDRINHMILINFLKGLIFIVCLLAIIHGLLIQYLDRIFIKPILQISSKMNNFIAENKPGHEPIQLNSSDELASMANSFNRMAADINSFVKRISDMQMETIFSLAKLAQSRDDDTGKHLERVQQYCYLLAQKLSEDSPYSNYINDTFINNIVNASALHDIGKVGISDLILLKPGKLTPEEFAEIQKHTTIGYETLKEVHSKFGNNSFIEMGMIIAHSHHEKWDGTGYPQKLKGEEIPLAARIMAVADVYDALSTKRVYKDAFAQEKCIEIIKEGKGTHFDPVIVDAFLEITNKFNKVREDLSD